MFVLKSAAEIAAMTEAERESYLTAKRQNDADQLKAQIAAAVKEATKDLKPTSKEEVEVCVSTAIDALKASLKTDSISKEAISEIKESIAQLKEGKGSTGGRRISLKAAIREMISGAAPQLKAMREAIKSNTWEKGKELVIEMKAATDVVVADWAQETATPDVFIAGMITEYAEDVRPQAYILPYIDKGTASRPSVPFMDKIPNQGAMEVTAEGALKPLISFSYKINWANAQKIAGRVKMSEEVLDDIPMVESMANNELVYEHGIEWQTLVFTKINAIAGAFVAGAMAATTVNPTKYDAIRAAIYGVKIASMGHCVPNVVLINSADAYDMGATKDKNNNYVLPPWVMPDGTKIAGVTIKEVTDGNATVAAGEFIVGDFRKLKNRTYKGFTIRIGQGVHTVNGVQQSDFETNMYTMIGESREIFFVYENEEVAFIKDSFTTVQEAIAAVPVV